MKKILILFLSYLILPSTYSFDLNSYIEIDTGSDSLPMVLTEKYYTNRLGEVYELTGTQMTLLYTLDQALIVDIEGESAVGYLSYPNYYEEEEKIFFLCEVSNCSDETKRTMLTGYGYFWGDRSFSTEATRNMFSGTGRLVLASKHQLAASEYKISVLDLDGAELDSFYEELFSRTSWGQTSRYLTATTGITKERDFKLLTASYGPLTYAYDVELHVWNESNGLLEIIPIELPDGRDINLAYHKGLAPIAIGDPELDEFGDKVYKVVFGGMEDKFGGKKVLWGKLKLEEGVAKLNDLLTEATYNFGMTFGGFESSHAYFHDNGLFTLSNVPYSTDIMIDFSTGVLSEMSHSRGEVRYDSAIYERSDSGMLAIKETEGTIKLFQKSEDVCPI